MAQVDRISLYDAATDFHSASFGSTVYWSMVESPTLNEELAAHLDAAECRYDPATFEGLVVSRPVSNHCFGFLNHGAMVVVFTADSVDEAQEAYAELEDYLVTISARGERSGVSEAFNELPIETESAPAEAAVSTTSNTLSATIDIDAAFDQVVFDQLFGVRDRYVYPEENLEIWKSRANQDRGSYKTGTEVGTLRITQAESGELYFGGNGSDGRGFVFDPERLWYQPVLHGEVKDAILNADGSLVIAERDDEQTTVRCFDSDGVEVATVPDTEMPLMALDSTNWALCYTPDIGDYTATVRDIQTGVESSIAFDDQVKRITWSPDQEGFKFSVGGPAPSHLIGTDGEIREVLKRETPYGPAAEIVEELLGEPTLDGDAQTAFNHATKQSPAAFRPHVSKLIRALAAGELPETGYPNIGQGFRHLASSIPEQFEPHIDQLLALIADEDSRFDTVAATILTELVKSGGDDEHIRAAVIEQLRSTDYRAQKRAASIAGPLLLANSDDDELRGCLVGCLQLDQPVDLSLAVCRALRGRQQGEQRTVETLVAQGKVEVLTKYTRLGSNDRGISNRLSMSFGAADADNDGSQTGEQVWVIDEADRGRAFYFLNKESSALLRSVATHDPEAVIPAVGVLTLDLLADGEAMKKTRENARNVLNTVVDQNPDGLSAVVDANVDTLLEALETGDGQTQRCVIRLIARGSSPKTQEPIREISSTPEHPLWDFTQTELREADSPLAPDTESQKPGRLAHLSGDAGTLHVPTPTEIADARAEQGAQHKDIARQTDVHWSYIEALEDGRINPPLSVLAEIWAVVMESEGGFDAFPTGTRCQNRRTAQGKSITTVADQAEIDETRLRQFEAGAADLTCSEVSRVLQALGATETAPAYPDRPTVRETWLTYVEQLAKALGELPRSSDAVAYAAIDERGTQVEGDATAEYGIAEDNLPELGHWAVFDGWNDVLNSLDIETEYRSSGAPLREELLEALEAASKAVDGVPTGADFERETAYTTYNLKKEFGGLTAAREAAGVDRESTESTEQATSSSTASASDSGEPTRDELTTAIKALADELGETPTTTQMNEQGAYTMARYYAEFDSWNEALEAAGVTPTRAERTTGTTREDLRTELQRLADELGRPPKTTDVKAESEFSLGRYYNEYDSWSEALADAGF